MIKISSIGRRFFQDLRNFDQRMLKRINNVPKNAIQKNEKH